MVYEYDRSRANGEKPKSYAFRKALLKELRLTKVRRSDIISNVAPEVIRYESANDVLNLQEQV